MARYWFGGGVADWTFTQVDGVGGFNDIAQVVGGVVVTFHNAETGGTQLTDLLDATGGTIVQVTSSDGTDGRAPGTIPPFQGPDGVTELWASAAGGPRALLTARLGQEVRSTTATATATAADLAAHKAAPNPHGTKLDDLADVDTTAATNGQVFTYDATTQTWKATTVPGLSGVVDLTSTQSISGAKTFDNASDTGTRVTLNAKATGQVGDVLVAWSGSDTGEGGARQRTTYLNEKGELRVIAAKGNSVGVRIKGQPTQTVHVLEQTDTANNPLAWWEPNGSWRAPNLGVMPMWFQDTVTVGTGTYRVYNPTGVPLTIRGTVASVGGNAPAGASIIVQLRVDGTAAYTSGNRPTIAAAGRYSGVASALSVTTWPAGSYLTVDVDQVGSTTAGSKLTIQVLAY